MSYSSVMFMTEKHTAMLCYLMIIQMSMSTFDMKFIRYLFDCRLVYLN